MKVVMTTKSKLDGHSLILYVDDGRNLVDDCQVAKAAKSGLSNLFIIPYNPKYIFPTHLQLLYNISTVLIH